MYGGIGLMAPPLPPSTGLELSHSLMADMSDVRACPLGAADNVRIFRGKREFDNSDAALCEAFEEEMADRPETLGAGEGEAEPE